MNNEKFTNLLAQDNNLLLNSSQNHLENHSQTLKMQMLAVFMHSAL